MKTSFIGGTLIMLGIPALLYAMTLKKIYPEMIFFAGGIIALSVFFMLLTPTTKKFKWNKINTPLEKKLKLFSRFRKAFEISFYVFFAFGILVVLPLAILGYVNLDGVIVNICYDTFVVYFIYYYFISQKYWDMKSKNSVAKMNERLLKKEAELQEKDSEIKEAHHKIDKIDVHPSKLKNPNRGKRGRGRNGK